MAGLQRSAQTFRRSGSSGLVWDERILAEGTKEKPNNGGACAVRQPELRHSRSVGMLSRRCRDDDAVGAVDDKKRKPVIIKPKARKDHRNQHLKEAFRTRDVAPAAEPPSPRVSAGCVLCSIFRGSGDRGQWRGWSSAQQARPRTR